ncbi:unnamed protein product, partial [marine sediment metagenome]
DSVQVWADGDWGNLVGDSVFVTANAINYNEVGSSEGTIQRYWIDGDQLPDIVMEEQAIKEENKAVPKNLEARVWPTITKDKVNVSGWNNVDVYNVAGRKVGTYGHSGANVYSFGLPEAAGVYHIINKESGKSK